VLIKSMEKIMKGIKSKLGMTCGLLAVLSAPVSAQQLPLLSSLPLLSGLPLSLDALPVLGSLPLPLGGLSDVSGLNGLPGVTVLTGSIPVVGAVFNGALLETGGPFVLSLLQGAAFEGGFPGNLLSVEGLSESAVLVQALLGGVTTALPGL
jgi:hypothetical protein